MSILDTKKKFLKNAISCSPKGGFFKKCNTVRFSEAQNTIFSKSHPSAWSNPFWGPLRATAWLPGSEEAPPFFAQLIWQYTVSLLRVQYAPGPA